MKVIHFSGGRTSAYMTIHNYENGDLVIFCDTGREHKGTYEFIDKFEVAENIPVIRLKYNGGFEQLISKRKAVPNQAQRFCTIELKVKTVRRYLRSLGMTSYTQLIGFRGDEPRRVKNYVEFWKKVKTEFPLYPNITKKDVIDYWKRKPYDLDIPSILGNCDACFMKGKNAIVKIYQQFPELAEKWIEDERRIGKTYIKGMSHEQMLKASKEINRQYSLELVEPEFNCSCSA